MRRALAVGQVALALALPLTLLAVARATGGLDIAWVALHACASAAATVASLPALLALAFAASVLALGLWHAVRQGLVGCAALAVARRRAVRHPHRAHRLGEELGIARLMVCDLPSEIAFCAGAIRPTVVVSTRLAEQLPEPALVALLAHEAAHARSRDPLWQVLGHVASRALWAFPLLSALADHARLRGEIAADRAAERRAGRPALAAALIALHESRAVAAAPALAGGPTLLGQRVEALAAGEPPPLRLPRRAVLRSTAGLALVGVLLALVVAAPALGDDALMPMPMEVADLGEMVLAWCVRLFALGGSLAAVLLLRGGEAAPVGSG